MNIMVAYLTSRDSADEVFLHLPAPETEISRILRWLQLPEVSTEKNCQMHRPNLLCGPFPLLEGQFCNLDELNYLAKRLDSLDKAEQKEFLAVAEATQADSPEKLINLSFNLHCYSVVDSFEKLEKLGRHLFLNERSTILGEPKIDYQQYALNILAQPPMAATQYGLVYRNANEPEQVYNGRQFPQYQYKGDAAALLTIYSSTASAAEYLCLPCEDIEWAKALHRLGDERLKDCQCSLDNHELPKSAVELFKGGDTLTGSFIALNRLAHAMSKLSEQQCANYLALCAWACADTIENHEVLCDNIPDFQVVLGVTNLYQYGKKLLLDNLELPDETALCYIDFEGYAQHRLDNNPGYFTDYGLIRYMGDSQDIAAMARLPYQQPIYSTLRLFSPIQCDLYEYDSYGDLKSEPSELEAWEAAEYIDSVEEAVRINILRKGPRGLAPYLSGGTLADKVYSMIPTVEEYEGRLYGVLECRLREPLNKQEYRQFCDLWSAQMSDGWGEGFEQKEIEVDNGKLCVHFWSRSREWSVQSETQLKGEPEQGMKMGGF